MSVRATNWAWEQGPLLGLNQGELLTLVRIADHADNDGVCWPGVKGLAYHCVCGESTIRNYLKCFEELHLIHRERRLPKQGRGRSTDAICLHLDAQDQAPGSSGRSSVDQPPADGRSTARSHADQPPARGGAYIEEPPVEPSVEPTPPPPIELPRVGRAQVTADEYRLADKILAAFNGAAGTRYTLRAHLRPLVGRIREHPELAIDQHSRIIATAFARPWWSDNPGPEVIYGNEAIFERAIEAARGAAGRKPQRVVA